MLGGCHWCAHDFGLAGDLGDFGAWGGFCAFWERMFWILMDSFFVFGGNRWGSVSLVSANGCEYGD